MTIGEKIKHLRKSFNLSQKALAEKSGVSEIAIRKYEAGDRAPKPEQIEKIATALCISPNALVSSNDSILRFETLGDLAGILILLHNSGIVNICGDRDSSGFLKPDTVSMCFNPILSSYFELISNSSDPSNITAIQESSVRIKSSMLLSDFLEWEKINYLLQTSLIDAGENPDENTLTVLKRMAEIKELLELELQKSQVLLDRSNGISVKILPN